MIVEEQKRRFIEWRGPKLRVGRVIIEARRWPWQEGYDWKGMKNTSAPLNSRGARFGGGWRYALGVEVGSTTVMFNLLYGMVSVYKERPERSL